MPQNPEKSTGFPQILLSQREKHDGSSYQRDNSDDPPNSALVIQHTESGEAWLKTEQKTFRVPSGHAMLFIHGENSSYGAAEGEYQLKFVSMSYTRSICDLFNHIRHEFSPVIQMKKGGQAENLMDSLMKSFLKRDDPLLQAEDLYRLLIAIYREQLVSHRGGDPVAYGHFLLKTQYRSPRNMSEWVEEIGITREHFSREFRKRYNESPTVFLRQRRLAHAQILMKTSPYSVSKIAKLSGFSNPQALRRAINQNKKNK